MASYNLGDRRRLMLLIGVVMTVGFLATSVASYVVSTASVREGIVESGLPLTSDNIYSEIQKDLLRPVLISSMMAQDTFLRDWVLDGEKDVSRVTNYLAEIKRRYDTVTSFFVSERTRTYYHADGVLKRMSPDQWRDAWYFRVREMAQPYEINFDPDLANQDAMTIFINARVLDYRGDFIGAAGVGLTVTEARRQIDRYRDRFGRRVYFVGRDGAIVLSGDAGGGREETIAARPGLSAIADQVLSTDGGSFEYGHDGRTVLLKTRFIPELGWHLFVEQEEEQAFSGIRNTLFLNLLICLIITGAVVTAVGATIGAYQRHIEQVAITDKLTGLLNRQGFDAVLALALKESRRSGEPLSLVLFDIDQFKAVNDRLGHLAGDEVIRRVGAAAGEALRESDVVCRWGGEEFLVLLKACPLDDATKIAEKIREHVRDGAMTAGAAPVTVSLGVARHESGEDVDRLLSRVDMALYEAKRKGRDRVACAA